MEKHLHIITHDVPWPIDYGGVFDLFYKIKSLHQKGIQIHLHCFNSKKQEYSYLENYCHAIYTYSRSIKIGKMLLGLPHIVASRIDKSLINRLSQDNHPIIFEGIHTTYPLYAKKLSNRKIYIRLHNVEWKYYLNLFYSEKNIIKKLYYGIESFLLKKYEKKIAPQHEYWSVSKEDADYYISAFHPKSIAFIPVFIPWNQIKNNSNPGNFCLYHGNLSIPENEKVVLWLIDRVFKEIELPLVIAGKNPSKKLINASHQYQNICLAENPSQFELEDLIKKAQINILPSLNNTGIKLKILNALYNGKHCLSNTDGELGIGIKGLCVSSNDLEELKRLIVDNFKTPISENDLEKRKILMQIFNNEKNAAAIITYLY